MGILDKLSNWFGAPYATFYRCSNCGVRFEASESACPECGGEVEASDPVEMSDYYWGPM